MSGSGRLARGKELKVALSINNKRAFDEWTRIRWTHSIERFPSDFEVEMVYRQGVPLPVPGDAVALIIKEELVPQGYMPMLNGYIDAVSNRISSGEHTVVMRGRSKCADLVDCSAEFPADESQPSGVPKLVHRNKTLTQIAEALCKPYGIAVELLTPALIAQAGGLSADKGFSQIPIELSVIPQYDVNVGETPYSIIERLARSQNLLLLDSGSGDLILMQPALPITHESGLKLGENILAMSVDLDFTHRYSEIDVFDQTVYSQGELGIDPKIYGKAFDTDIRHRRYMGFSESPYVPTADWTQRRATWECNRRTGRSQVIHVTVDTWTDVQGVFWQVNGFVTLNAPYLGVDGDFVIAEVTFSRDVESGTTAQLTLMPEIAFSLEPVTITRLDPALGAGINQPSSDGSTVANTKVYDL